MTTLETLKVEAREKILGVAVNRQSSLYDVEVLADEITSKVFEAALQEALGKVPGEYMIAHTWKPTHPRYQFNRGFNAAREEITQGITSLLPAN